MRALRKPGKLQTALAKDTRSRLQEMISYGNPGAVLMELLDWDDMAGIIANPDMAVVNTIRTLFGQDPL